VIESGETSMAKGYLRFCHLQQRNLVKSWAQLDRMQKLYGFPKGRMISPNVRGWTEEEIDAYYESCPVEGPEARGAAKQRRDRRRKAAASTDASTST
jgi:predicted DNA-binding transcriptional regulator AlpA